MEKEKKRVVKNFIVFGVIILFVIFGMWFIMATLTGITFVTPATDSNVSGSYTFKATISGTDADNVTFYWWNTSDSSWVELEVNNTSGAEPFTISYNTTNLPDGTGYVFNATARNDTTTETTNNTGITLDNTAPVITIALPSAGWKKDNLTLYVNSTDVTTNVTNSTMYFWFGNTTGNFSETLLTSCPYVSTAIGFNCSATFDTNNLADGNYTLWVNASDTMAIPNVKNQSLILIGIDNTNPVATLSCSPSSVRRGSTVTCTCSGVDSGSGINDSATSAVSTPSTSSTGTFTAIGCSVTDYAGNSDSATDTYTVTSSSSGGTAPTYEWAFQKRHSWSRITPGEVAIMKDFDEEMGLKQIQIRVNNEVQNVGITVSKYDKVPAKVSVEKSGKTYRYLQINGENLQGNLKRATIRIQIEKSWMTANNLKIENLAMFKFNENINQWEELDTNYIETDDNFYYYDIELNSFSYFAISEKSIIEKEEINEGSGEETEEIIEEKDFKWWKTLLIVLIGIIVIYLIYFNKKRIVKFFKKR